jgi:hypothetical protein
MNIKMSADTQKRKKPNKKKRTPQETSQDPTIEKTPEATHQSQYNDSRQRLRMVIAAMKKDRAKGSFSCEENANHDY